MKRRLQRVQDILDGKTNLPQATVEAYRKRYIDGYEPEIPERKKLLGDMIAKALALIGITPERVEAWMGRPCSCKERQEKLNQLHAWARRVLSGKIFGMKKHLENIIADEEQT